MKKTMDEIIKMIKATAPMGVIDAAMGDSDISTCLGMVFEPPIDLREECRKRWEALTFPFRTTIERKIGNTWYVIETECAGSETLADKVKRLIFSEKVAICS